MSKSGISYQFELALKDQLRTVRYQIGRRVRGGADHVPQPVARMAGAVLSGAEAAVNVFSPHALRKSSNFIFPLPVSAYFGPPAADQHLFTIEMYYALKGLLHRFGADQCLVSEQAIEVASGNLWGRHGALITQALADSKECFTRLSAALAIELAAVRPVREMAMGPHSDATPKSFILSPNAYAALVIGLAIAIASQARADDPVDAQVAIRSADAVVDARFAGWSKALSRRKPLDFLASEFAELLPFLP